MTSDRPSLCIDAVPVPDHGGVIGLTRCPGKQGMSSDDGRYGCDLGADLDVIRTWGAQAVVTLMKRQELADFRVQALGEAVQQLGMTWLHLPICEGQVPDKHFERSWRTAGMQLRTILRAGDRVLVHSRGGMGRAGTIAARLLVELGLAPAMALRQIRAARHGMIENRIQECYVLSRAKVPAAQDERHARILACLLGGALGDALGYRVEFDTLEQIRATYGAAGITDPIGPDGVAIVSDDTQMTLFALEGMLRARGQGLEDTLGSLRQAWLDWYATQQEDASTRHYYGKLGQQSALHVARAPGTTCINALSTGGQASTAQHRNNSKGCGAVMRVAPLGFFPKWLDETQTLELGQRSAALTHTHRSAQIAAGAMAVLIHRLLLGEALESAILALLERLVEEPGHGEVSRTLFRTLTAAHSGATDHPHVIDGLWGDPDMQHESSRGWVAEEALAIGIYAALVGSDLQEVINIAANHSGDSDSTASIAGQLYGAWKGSSEIGRHRKTHIDIQYLLQHFAACASVLTHNPT